MLVLLQCAAGGSHKSLLLSGVYAGVLFFFWHEHLTLVSSYQFNFALYHLRCTRWI